MSVGIVHGQDYDGIHCNSVRVLPGVVRVRRSAMCAYMWLQVLLLVHVVLCCAVLCCAVWVACALSASIVMRLDMISGRLAQMVERPLRMREVGGSIPPVSTLYSEKCLVYTHSVLHIRTFHQLCMLPLFTGSFSIFTHERPNRTLSVSRTAYTKLLVRHRLGMAMN